MEKEKLLQDYYTKLNYGGIRYKLISWLKKGYSPSHIEKMLDNDFQSLFSKFYKNKDLEITQKDISQVALKFIQDTENKKEFQEYLNRSYGDGISLNEYLGHFYNSNWPFGYWDWGQEMVNDESNIYDIKNFDKLWNGELDIHFTDNQLQRMIDSVNEQDHKETLQLINHTVVKVNNTNERDL